MFRIFLPLLFVTLGLTLAQAQVQEKKLIERLMKPDMNMTFDANKGSPSSNRSVQGRSASSKSFGTKEFSAKQFSAREFFGSKSATLAKTKYTTAEALTTSRNFMPEAGKTAPTKTMAVTEARDARKAVETRDNPIAKRDFIVHGRSQERFNEEAKTGRFTSKPPGYGGDLKQLSIGDIRELLNKNK